MKITTKNLFLVFSICFFFQGFAQKKASKVFNLEWDLSAQIMMEEGVSIPCPLVKDNFIDAEGLPVFMTQWEVFQDRKVLNYQIKNIRYEPLDLSKAQTLAGLEISSDLRSEFVIAKGGQKRYAHLSLTPLLKKGNTVLRIVSFELVYELENTLKRSVQRRGAVSIVQDSPLARGTWYKFAVDRSGVFKLNFDFLQRLGIDVSGMDPTNLRIFGNGGGMLLEENSGFRYANLQENSLYVSGEQDGVFDASDYVLFYAEGPDAWEASSREEIRHRKNLYSDLAYYFISVDQGVGKRISIAPEVNTTTTDAITTYTDFDFYEEDLVNLLGTGKQWFGDSFRLNSVRTYPFNFENLDPSQEVKIRVRGVAQSSSNSSMDIRVNSGSVHKLNYNRIDPRAFNKANADEQEISVGLTSDEIEVQIAYNNFGNPSAEAYLDFIEIIADKVLTASGKQFSFRNFSSVSEGKVLEYSIANPDQINWVWDVTDFTSPEIITNQSTSTDHFRFKANSGTLRTYTVVNESDGYTPIFVQDPLVENQNLHGLRDIQYLIVTKKDWMHQAQRLADFHTTNSGLSSAVVSLQQIYNEFGSGSPDLVAIRDFVKFLYDQASSTDKKVKYLCLLGDASYDYKNRIPDNNNLVPTFHSEQSFSLVTSYATDDFYGMMDEEEGSMQISASKQDVATGRILASNLQEAQTAIDKIINYHSIASLGAWRNQLTLIADDLESSSESVIQNNLEQIADLIKANKPQYNIKKLYADSFVQEQGSGGERYPDLNAALSNIVESGSLLMDYFGHGGEGGLAHERILEVHEIQDWKNYDRLPLFITVTCDFSRFDNPARFTAGEEMYMSPHGGAVSLISTARKIFISYGSAFNKILIQKLLDFDSGDYTISQALMESKNQYPSSVGQHYFIFSFGDPAMKLGRPRPNIQIKKMNDRDLLVSKDTLKALSKVKFEGEVTDAAGALMEDFDGTLTAIIYDKEIQKTTLDNDGFGITMDFDVQESKVFKGKTAVKNGLFSFEFVVPKDIKPAYGTSKISLYAENEILNKGGVDLQTIIGGIDEAAESDAQGPDISLFLNDKSFVDGGVTNASPDFIVELFDANGINTSLGAIGHNIALIMDQDESNPVILNEYYESDLGDYTRGSLRYKLRNLEPGAHSLKLKAWDTHNNSSEKTLQFTVVDDGTFALENVLNYPNPFINYTEFWFQHNKPSTPLDVKIFIFTVSGKLVKSINQVIETSGGLSRSITWDGTDDFGQKLGKGVYVYKLEVTSQESGASAEVYEKLVLLQ
jgi:hypothetical protein